MKIEGFQEPARLPIQEIDYLTDLWKEVKEAYLTKTIGLNLLDADQLDTDHLELHDLVHLTLGQTQHQGKRKNTPTTFTPSPTRTYFTPTHILHP